MMDARATATFDLVLRGGSIVLPHGVYAADLALADGRIAGIFGPGQAVKAAREEHLAGLVVMPGVIDAHVHMRDPGQTDQEDFATGTRAAVLGGVTTVLDHPNTIPTVSSVDRLAGKRRRLETQSYVDYGLYGAAGGDSLGAIGALARNGVVAFKTFLQDPPVGREAQFEGLWVTDDGVLLELMEKVAVTGLPLVVHAENNAIIKRIRKDLRARGDNQGDAHARSRPVVAEEEAITRVCVLAAAAGCRMYIPHISSGSGALAGAHYKRKGQRVVLETCPQYLFFTDTEHQRVGPYAKIDPPLRSRSEQEMLWRCLADGTIDCIASDHAPHAPDLKERGWEDIFAAPSGIPGVEVLLPLMLTAVSERRLDLSLASRLLATNPARVFGLCPTKGEIMVGADADLVVVDPDQQWDLDSGKMITKSRDSARMFDGFQVTGRPVMTISRGVIAAREGEVLVSPGDGRWLSPVGAP